MQKIAIQGIKGSFHYIVASDWFGDNAQMIECSTFAKTFETLANNEVDFAVVAIENSLYGSINEVYDLLLTYNPHIVGEVVLQVRQCLIGLEGSKLTDIKRVYSQAPALAQSSEFLDLNLAHAERVENNDTAASVRLVKKLGDKSNSAIASQHAAEIYGLQVLKKNIENHHQNFTRFLIIGPKQLNVEGADKASIAVKTDHKPGALYKLLGIFAAQNINLTKLQSRPIKGEAWRYLFYIDLEVSAKKLDIVLQNVRDSKFDVTNFGFYKKSKLHNL